MEPVLALPRQRQMRVALQKVLRHSAARQLLFCLTLFSPSFVAPTRAVLSRGFKRIVSVQYYRSKLDSA